MRVHKREFLGLLLVGSLIGAFPDVAFLDEPEPVHIVTSQVPDKECRPGGAPQGAPPTTQVASGNKSWSVASGTP